MTAGSGCPLSVGEPADDSVSPSFPSQRANDIMGIPTMPGQDDPKADIREQGGSRGGQVDFILVVLLVDKWVQSVLCCLEDFFTA